MDTSIYNLGNNALKNEEGYIFTPIFSKCVTLHKTYERFTLCRKDYLIKFLNDCFDAGASPKMRKAELIDMAYERLNLDTVQIFTENLHNFGLACNDVVEILGCSKYMVRKLSAYGKIRKIGEFVCPSDCHKVFYIYNMIDVIEIYGKLPPKRTADISEIEMSDSNLAAALYLVNKSATVSRETEIKAYNNNNYAVCQRSKSRSQKLFKLIEATINKLLGDGRIEFVGLHRQKSKWVKIYNICGFMFQVPYCGDIDKDKVLRDRTYNKINFYRAIDVFWQFNEAVKLLELYVGTQEHSKKTK